MPPGPFLPDRWNRKRRLGDASIEFVDPFTGATIQRPPHAERLWPVLGEVYRRGRRKRPEQVRALLDRELEAAGLSFPEDAKNRFVHDLATEPPWLAWILFRRFYLRRRQADGRHWPAGVPTPSHPEFDALADRLFKVMGVCQVGWSESESDRIIYVRLVAWSDKLAEQVRRKAAPREVRFID